VPAAPDRRPGDVVGVVMTKWPDHPHWRFVGVWLGRDEHGEWLGFPAGSHQARPGLAFDSEVATVSLVPAGGAGYVATFHAPGGFFELYVDLATPPRWDGHVLRSVDLDLDVVRRTGGTAYVDDEDEFLEHTVTLGYSEELVDLARSTCEAVLASVRSGAAPYDGATSARWLGVLAGLDAVPAGPEALAGLDPAGGAGLGGTGGAGGADRP